ncbi:MAG: phosphoribosyltransferase family protein, partial [Victivallales bacterium]|nr:phosphoribosyltransferase family protein [Victivallales bacterium]
MHPNDANLPEVLLSAEVIAGRIRELGKEIARDYANIPLTVITVANGGIVFAADLIRAIELPLQLDSLMVGSYGS